MKCKLLLSLAGIMMSYALTAQDSLNSQHLSPYAYSFTIKEGKLSGEGGLRIRDYTRNTQFTLLGEMHQSAQLAKLTEVLLGDLQANGYRYFAVESGPETAKKLMDYANPPAATAESLRHINKEYGSKLFQRVPFIFFHGKEDAAFLQKASELGYQLWGLDQEFIYSYNYWIDQLRELIVVESPATMKLLRQCRSKIRSLYFKKIFSKKANINCTMLQDPQIQGFFSTFKSNEREAQAIIQALNDSWNIYCLYEKGRYDSNNLVRAQYMQQNFAAGYQKALQTGKDAKVFIKLGNVHTSRNKSRMGVDDIGSYVHRLAEKNGTGVASFRFMRRYYDKKGKRTDNAVQNNWKLYVPLLQLGSADSWVVVDVRPIRTLLKEGKLVTSKVLRYEIENYDFILLAPADKKVDLNM